jgi:small-conductance mechanosensitive channel
VTCSRIPVSFGRRLPHWWIEKPGRQFTIKRKALATIKQAFEANGIKLASPSVQVVGGDERAAAPTAQKLAHATPP